MSYISRVAILLPLLTIAPALAQTTTTLPGLVKPAQVAATPPRTPQVLGIDDDDQEVREKLKKRTSVDWMQVELRHAVEALGRDLEIQVQLDPEGLEESGASKEEEVDLVCKNRRGDQVLKLLLEPLHLTYIVKHGTLIITSEEKANEQLTTRVYNVRDLVEPARAGELPARASGPLPVPEGTQIDWSGRRDIAAKLEYYQDFDTLIDLITTNVAPDSWTDNGGTGSISGFRGLLVVSQTEDFHSDLELLLRQLRVGQSSQPGDVIHLP